MRFERRFTTAGQDPYSTIEFRQAASEIRNPDGTVVFKANNVEVPEQFSFSLVLDCKLIFPKIHVGAAVYVLRQKIFYKNKLVI